MRFVFWMLVAWLVVAFQAHAAVQVVVEEPVVVGRHATIEVIDLQPGEARVETSAGVATTWRHRGGPARVPVLVPSSPGEVLEVLVNDEPVKIPLEQSPTRRRVGTIWPRVFETLPPWQTEPSIGTQIVAGSITVIGGVLIVWLRRRLLLQLLVALVLMGAIVLLWWLQPTVLVREASLSNGRWILLKQIGNTPEEVVLPAAVLPLPVAFSEEHLTRLSPTLRLDTGLQPQELGLTLAPGEVAVLWRPAEASPPPVPAWAAALGRVRIDR
jgi:hypothetical protein